MCFLHDGIGLGQRGSRLAQPEAELTEHTLALANPDGNAIPLLNPGTEGLSVPEIPAQTNLPRRVSQDSIHSRQLFFRQTSGPSRSFSLQQSRQTVSFKTPHPILHRPWRIAQKMGHFRTGHTLGYQKHSMETMIVAGFFRAANLILQSENDRGRVCNGKWFHSSMKPQPIRMRNYLCRCVYFFRDLSAQISSTPHPRGNAIPDTSIERSSELDLRQAPQNVG